MWYELYLGNNIKIKLNIFNIIKNIVIILYIKYNIIRTIL